LRIQLSGETPQDHAPITVTLTASNPQAFQLPSTVQVHTNRRSAAFFFTALSPGQFTISATSAGSSVTKQLAVTVLPIHVVKITTPGGHNSVTSSEIKESNAASFSVHVDWTPAGPIAVNLSSSNPSVTVPNSITLSQTSESTPFTVTAVSLGTAKVR